MISIEQRREIYTEYFCKTIPISIRKLSENLNIHRITLSKIINEYRKSLDEHNLLSEDDLSKYIDLIVVEPKRKKRNVKKYVVTPQHIDIIKNIISANEKIRIRQGKAKTIFELFCDFNKIINDINKVINYYNKEVNDLNREIKPIKSISHSTFYNLVREIKNNVLILND